MPRRGPPQTPKNSLEQSRRISDRQTIAVTDLLSEGPIYGLVDGQASVFLNDDRAAPISQAAQSKSRTALRISLTNGSTSATITNGGSNPLTVTANGKKYLIVRAGSGTQPVTASNSSAGTSDGAIVTTLTTTDGANFFTDAMVSTAGATPESHVPFRLTRTSSSNGATDEGEGEGVLTTRTNNTTAEFTGGAGGPGGVWVPEGTYVAEVDKVVEIASVSGVTVTLASAWTGTTASYKFDVSGTIVDDSDVVSQTQISAYEGVTTQFRVGTLSQTPFGGEGGEGSTAISNSGPSAGGVIEKSNNFSGSQSPKELIASSASGFNLTASQIQEVDEARVTIAYANGFYAVSGKGNNKHTFIRYRFQIALKKIGSGSFETPITTSPSSHTVHSGLYTNATTFVETFDLNQYRPFADFKIIIDRVDSHENPGFDGVGETFHDWQNVTSGSISNTTCIIKDIVTHPYSAMAKVSFSTKQFQGMPSRTYHLRGLKVQVPSNYVTREEAADGVANYNRDVTTGAITTTYQDWDGAFKLNKVYTNNPAWVFYDILTNNRYGLGDFLKATDIDKYSLFKIARYCDELVDDGKGGTEPRFTANLYFTKQTDAFKVLKDMATIFRGMLYFIDGQILPVMDSPAGPVYNFSKSNVIDGNFSYETTGSKTRVNQVIVSWINPNANYKAEPLIVEDRQNIVKQNRVITENAVAMGAITEGQAVRFGRWKLWTAANQKEIVSFSTALNASFLIPGDIINIQDSDRNTLRYSGRVSNTGTKNTSTIPIDSSVTVNGTSSYELSIIFITPGAFATSNVTVNGIAYEAGELIPQAFIDSNGDGTYTLQNIDTLAKSVNAKATANATQNLTLNFGDTTRVEKRTLNNSAGATTSLTVSSAFTATPDAEAIWGLTEVDSGGDTLTASPKQYKILAMSEKESNTFEITAVEFYNEKFAAVDEDFTTYIADTVYPAVTATDIVPPVQSVFASNQMTNISLGEILELHWIPPTNVGGVTGVYEHLAGFEIFHPFIDRENPIRVMDPDTTFYAFKDLPIGTYKIAVKVINVLDNLSEPEIITIKISDKFDEPIPRTQKGIPYTGDVNAGMQMSNAGVFSFKNATYTFKHPSTRGRDTVGTSNPLSNAQDCSGMVATSTIEGNIAGEFLTDHYYLLLDNSETNDKIKLLRYHKPNGVGTPYFYDSGNGSSTTRFGSALTGTFTKAANASKVIGSGTNFTGQIEQGDVLKLGSEEIEVSAVESNTVLYLAKATGTAHSGVQGFIPNIRIDYINDCIIARAFKKSSDNSFNFVSYAKTDGEVKNAPDVIADGTVDSNQIADDAIGADQIADNAIGADQINVSLSDLSSGALASGTTVASTPAAGDNSLKVATTQYADRAVSNLVDSAPANLDTLNELAAALADDAAFSSTVNTALGNRVRIDVSNQSLSSTEKTNALTNLGIANVENKSSSTIRGELTSSNVTTALGFTPYNSTNPSGFVTSSGVTGVSGTAPISVTSGATPTVSISAATTTAAGSLSAADKIQLNNLSTNLAAKANLSDPDFTGTPTAPTATNSTSDTQIATTAFVHAVASSEASGAVNNAAITLAAGNSGIAMDSDNVFTVNQSAPETITISHADTSNVSDLTSDNSGNTFIQDIDFDFDTYGHVTAASVSTGSVTIGNGVLTLAGGVDLHINESTKTFSANQSGDNTITFDHDTISRTNNNSSASPSYGGTFTAIDSITTSTQGHVTAVNTKTVTIPASDNTEGVTSLSSTTTNQLTVTDGSTATPELNIVTGAVADSGTALATGDQIYDHVTSRIGSFVTSSGVTSLSSTTTDQLTVTDGSTATPELSIVTGTVANSGTALATGDQIYDHVTSRISGLTGNAGTITSVATTAPITGGTVTSGGVTIGINEATTSLKGAMSTADKTKLDIFSVSGVTDIPLNQTFGNIAAKLANFETLNATTANVDFLSANRVISRDIRVGPDDTINATATVNGRQYTITTVGNTDFTAIGADSSTVGVLFTATGAGLGTGTVRDYNTVALIGADGTTLSGKGAHLNSEGDFFVGVHDGARIFFDQSAGTMTVRGTLNASDINTGTLNASNITVTNLSASSINTGALNASLMTTGTLNASNITVTNLDANSINGVEFVSGNNGTLDIDAANNTPGIQSIRIGSAAGGTGAGSTSIGYFAGNFFSGVGNTALGRRAGVNFTSGASNILIGSYVGYGGASNISNPYPYKSGSSNIGIGGGSQEEGVFRELTTGSGNISIGSFTARQLTTANANIFIGGSSGRYATGSTNIFVGKESGMNMTTGSNNVIIGAFNGNENSLDIRTSSGNIVLSDGNSNIRLYVNSSGAIQFNQAYTFPTADGSANQILQTDGSGALTFATVSSAVWSTSGSNISYTSGNVLIGTTIAQRSLKVGFSSSLTSATSNASGFAASSSTVGKGLMINNISTTDNTYANLDFLCGVNGIHGRLLYRGTDHGDEYGQFEFITTEDGGAVTAMKIMPSGNVRVTGSCTATSFPTSSDYRLKSNIQDISYSTPRLLALKPKNFQWKESETVQDGFLAHEVAEIVPEAVVGEKDGTEMQTLDQTKLIPILVKTIQELEARITALESS